MLVREDFFSGFAGSSEGLERGMRKCEEVLAKDPKNAEALGMAWLRPQLLCQKGVHGG
jgi:hypothetical protein